jgi:iron complex outermembrane receptor protein
MNPQHKARGRRIPGLAGASTGAILAALAIAPPAYAQQATAKFKVVAQPLSQGLLEFGRQAKISVAAPQDLVAGKTGGAVEGELATELALNRLLSGTGLEARFVGADAVRIVQAGEGGSPQADRAAGEVEALIVTAQKREEDIQDVPIAMSAFSQETLTTRQIAGGPDLMTQIPNFTFTKTNFASYSITIRGIGTQAISATVDPAVAVAFNNTPFIRNRFFEQEFYDLNRVEVLRGPQGTLYGRNATAGVVNLITARPKHFFEARLSADLGNYSSRRLEGMVNLPLVDEKVALRLAGALTQRDGYVLNGITGTDTDNRDLWSVRATLGFEPTDSIRAYLTYEHFEEDDGRLRSGKQLCTRHEPPEFLMPDEPDGGAFGRSTYISQGCKMGSLYEDEAFQTPNGFALPYYGPLANVGLPFYPDIDPYLSTTQSKDLRVVETSIVPIYQAKTDILHLSMEFDITDSLTLTSETGYSSDEFFSFNDYNRFNTTPDVFNPNQTFGTPRERGILDENGVFCDPQLGCANRLVAADVSSARSDQFSQEFRISSNFDGAFNFHLGTNFLRYDTEDKYYVFINTLSMYTASYARISAESPWNPGVTDCFFSASRGGMITNPFDVPPPDGLDSCMYIDPNPIGSLNDNGRNYFLSKNPFRLISYAVFGEAVYNFTPDLKLTAGLRFTVDKKRAPIHPTWLLGQQTYGTPIRMVVEQEWREPTGRLVLDWKPHVAFTDETLVYASYAHGYKAGGANPPLPGALPILGNTGDIPPAEFFNSVQPPEFGPEFIDAFELGSKNTLLDGKLTVNANAFYYDYKGYQISQIANRSAVNLNFDAEVWGAEFEADWRPLENLKLGFKGGYEKTKLGDDQFSIDMIDRTAGNPDWYVYKPFPAVPSNCIAPTELAVEFNRRIGCGQYISAPDLDPITLLPYVPDPQFMRQGGVLNGPIIPLLPELAGYRGFHPRAAPGGGAGIAKNVGGNELPNAPDFTTTFTADYTLPLRGDWLLTLHADYYRQSEAWTRIFNEDPYDKLRPFSQINLAAIFANEEAGWRVMAYIKNVEDKDNITGAFLNSDDSGLTTNIFLNEPRLYGLRVTKEWTGAAWGFGERHSGPRPFTVEIGAGSLRLDAPEELYTPQWAGEFTSPNLPYPLYVQDEDLDWGDDREVKLSYKPVGGLWSVAAGVRYGRTNGDGGSHAWEEVTGGWTGPGEDGPPVYGYDFDKYVTMDPNFTNARAQSRAEFTLAEFMVGRDVGLGAVLPQASSMLSFGVRYAAFDSERSSELRGSPDGYVPPYNGLDFVFGAGGPPSSRTIHHALFSAERSFEGAGPVLSWDVSSRLLGNDDTGGLNLDVSLTGGVLFGKQEMTADYNEYSRLYEFFTGELFAGSKPGEIPAAETINDPAPIQRNDDVTVPILGVSLGLSYNIDRVKIGAGYRFERYFNAIDGGVDEAAQYDRTIAGPYLKLSVGFGG